MVGEEKWIPLSSVFTICLPRAGYTSVKCTCIRNYSQSSIARVWVGGRHEISLGWEIRAKIQENLHSILTGLDFKLLCRELSKEVWVRDDDRFQRGWGQLRWTRRDIREELRTDRMWGRKESRMTFRRLARAIRKMVVPLSRQEIGGMHVGAGRKKEEVQLGMLNLGCLKCVITMISRRQSDEKRSGLRVQIPLCLFCFTIF